MRERGPEKGKAYRPQAAFRVGVVGERTLDPALEAPLHDLARQAFARIAACVREVATGAAERRVYRDGDPALHCLSALAGASDVVLANAAIESGFQMSVVLPFEREEWHAQAGEGLPGLTSLLDAAGPRVLQLDGTTREVSRLPWPARTMAQDAAVRLVTRNCDLVVAIWDGRPGQAPGDVAAAVHAALAASLPVLWLQPGPPCGVCLMRHPQDLHEASPEPTVPLDVLEAVVRKVMAVPRPARAEEAHWIEGIENGFLGKVRADDDPIGAYLARTLPRPTSPSARFGKLFRKVRNALAGHARVKELPIIGSGTPHVRPPGARHYEALFGRPDVMADYYAGWYRSTFLSMFMLGALATVMVLASALFEEHRLWFLGAELVMLLVGVGLVRWERSANCHGHWLDYRLLAEAIRLQQFLAPLGHSISLRPLIDGAPAQARRWEWVSWYYSALLRERPIDGGRLDGGLLNAIRTDVHDNLLASANGQVAYFASNALRYRNASQLLQGLALIIFPTAIALLGAKLIFAYYETNPHILTLLAGLLPVLATAMFAIRSHGEFEVLAQNGERIAPQLEQAAERLRLMEFDGASGSRRSLASEALAAEVLGVATIVLSDIQGWSLLFNVKVVEAA